MKRKLLFAIVALMCSVGTWAETDYTSLMSSNWTSSTGDFGGGKERYQGANYGAGKIMYQSFTAPAAGIYEIKFYAVASSTSGRGFNNIYGDNIAQAYATAGSNKATVAMTVIDQTGCTLVEAGNIRTLSVEAAQGETIEYGIENIATGGNWYTIKEFSAKMKTVAEIFQDQYDEAYAIWENSTENEVDAKATFKTSVDALNTAMSGTLAEAQTASDNLAAALVTYESKSYPVKGSGVKYDFTSKMNMAINAWTCAQGNGPAQYGFTGATETYKGSVMNNGDVMHQTITGLANGEYEIHFYAVANSPRGESTSGANLATVYANEVELPVEVYAQDGCTPSDYERTLTVMVTDGSITYGISCNGGGNWYVCKNVALYMTGAPDLSDYYDAIAGKLTTANGLTSSPMNATVLSALQNAIDATTGYTSITVIGTLEDLSNNLTTAINNANASISKYSDALTILNAASSYDAAGQSLYAANTTVAAIQTAYTNRTLEEVNSAQEAECAAALTNYDAWLEMKAYADALVAAANDNATANTTLASAILTQATAVSEATNAAAIATATSTLKDAMVTYVGVANPVGDGVKFNLTFMLTNPDVSGFANDSHPAGWYCDYSGGQWHDPRVNRNAVYASDPTKNASYEFWTGSAVASNEFTVYQQVTLPEGTYEMNCLAFADANGVDGATNNQVYFYANDTQGSLIVSSTNALADASISFVNESEQLVKIGLKACTGNQYRWMGMGYVELYKVPAAAAVVLNESVAYVEEAKAADVELTKTIYEGWNTVILPFSMTAAEITDVFGAGTLYGFTDADGGTLYFAEATTLSAHTPYLFKANAAKNINAQTIAGRTITVSTNDLKTNGTDYNFVGTYTPYAQGASPIVVSQDYVLGNDNCFHQATVKNAMKAFRAYIKANEPSQVKALIINLDGETTGIQSINGQNLNEGTIFNLAGQKMSKLQRGVNIVNGKKVLVK